MLRLLFCLAKTHRHLYPFNAILPLWWLVPESLKETLSPKYSRIAIFYKLGPQSKPSKVSGNVRLIECYHKSELQTHSYSAFCRQSERIIRIWQRWEHQYMCSLRRNVMETMYLGRHLVYRYLGGLKFCDIMTQNSKKKKIGYLPLLQKNWWKQNRIQMESSWW